MRRSVLTRGLLAAATALSLAFGTVQAFAAPVKGDTRDGICLWEECRAMCGTGCGGECIGVHCYCDC
jgi:hypothetical protein